MTVLYQMLQLAIKDAARHNALSHNSVHPLPLRWVFALGCLLSGETFCYQTGCLWNCPCFNSFIEYYTSHCAPKIQFMMLIIDDNFFSEVLNEQVHYKTNKEI